MTDKLWSIDINANADATGGLLLLCPVEEQRDEALGLLDDRIDVVDRSRLAQDQLQALIRRRDVVEVPGNFDWAGSALERRAVRLARLNGKLSVLGISSNRAKTTVMNAVGRPLPSRLRARARAISIGVSQRYLARRCDAVRVVGEGLLPLVEGHAKVLRAEVASWIRDEDIGPPRDGQFDPVRVAIASRLEPMKGVSLGIEAIARAIRTDLDFHLDIIGAGVDYGPLRHLVGDRGLAGRAQFLGQLGYPDAFLEALRKTDYLLLTNLNDEQPRVIFDAISQGVVPICPANPACLKLDLDPRVFYDPGSASALSRTLQRLATMPDADRKCLRAALIAVARSRTITTMHADRRAWILSLLQRRRRGSAR